VQDETVTIRYRDSMEQERVSVSQLRAIIADKVSMQEQLKKL
jgi:glycyl-tRNA synthetase